MNLGLILAKRNRARYLFVSYLPAIFWLLASGTQAVVQASEEYSSPKRVYGHVRDSERHRLSLLGLRGAGVEHLDRGHSSISKFLGAGQLPPTSDLRSGFPEPFDQGQLGSCTANAIVGAAMYTLEEEGISDPGMLSRLYLYYKERSREGDVGEDAGASLADGIYVLHKTGVCLESLWPYSDDGVLFKKRPTTVCNKDASTHRDLDVTKTASVDQDLGVIKAILAQSCPVVMGIQVYSSFESQAVARTGIVPMPKKSEKLLGGHAVVLAGYDDTKNTFLVRNSWGTGWGQAGYFELPYDYVMSPKLASDFWKINKMSDPHLTSSHVERSSGGAAGAGTPSEKGSSKKRKRDD